MLKFIRMVKARAKTDFDFLVLLTMYDGRTGLAKKIQRELREKFGDQQGLAGIPATGQGHAGEFSGRYGPH